MTHRPLKRALTWPWLQISCYGHRQGLRPYTHTHARTHKSERDTIMFYMDSRWKDPPFSILKTLKTHLEVKLWRFDQTCGLKMGEMPKAAENLCGNMFPGYDLKITCLVIITSGWFCQWVGADSENLWYLALWHFSHLNTKIKQFIPRKFKSLSLEQLRQRWFFLPACICTIRTIKVHEVR